MSKVTITGNAWDGDLDPIPTVNAPELFFRPIATSAARGLLTDREIPAESFNLGTGAFTVQLESQPGLMYAPILRWLKNPEDPKNRARGQTEWEPFYPGAGGDISSLSPIAGLFGLLFGFGPPPSYLFFAIYLDITGPKIRIYGPKGVV
ncbi:hypothetical protein [Microbacterium sp.]